MFDFLTIEGLIFVSVAWISVLWLTTFCFYKVLTGNKDLEDDPELDEDE